MDQAEEMPRRLPEHCIEDTDRNGNVRVYLRIRKKMRHKVRLLGTPWTPEFMVRYERALAGLPPEPEAAKIIKPSHGTWRWLCHQYFTSADFLQKLAPQTQRTRRQILEATFGEPINPESAYTFADCPIVDMTKKAVRVLRDRKMGTPEAANSRVKAMRAVFKQGLAAHEDIVLTNPARDIDYFKTGSEGFYTWTIEDVLQFMERHPAGTKARLALCVLLYTGVRRSNAVLLGGRRSGTVRLQVQKRRREQKPKWLELTILPELEVELALHAATNLTWITTKFGKPFTSNGFGNWFKDRCREAELERCSAHGLRKTGATIAAENGATDAQLMAIFGWATVKMAADYRRKADQKRLAAAAMSLISIERPNGAAEKA